MSDYGLADEFVGVCHGVIRRVAPAATVVDITHGVLPNDIAVGAALLAEAVRHFPPAVHLAVVDPGVGTKRRGIVLQTGSGSCLVGPDNGLLIPASEALGGPAQCYELTNPTLRAERPSQTFHGRDIFAPAAGHIARGVELSAFGPAVPVAELVTPEPPFAGVVEGRPVREAVGEVVLIDRFGNLTTSLAASHLAAAGAVPGDVLDIVVGDQRLRAPYGDTFASVGSGEPVVLVDSHDLVAICYNRGSAAEALGAGRGTKVTLSLAGGSPAAGI
ncbi:MAG TPA: SAM-dependent chlorinase/fluorinase [Actinomycetota bacterium]|nr:SAM-dependent chlorinase/fluorinase [Actinomycetota bacterium]